MSLYILGVATLAYSLLTDYEYGVLKIFPMAVHLALDVFLGVLLACSPWIFGFAGEVYIPHLVLGFIGSWPA